jgi:hypothetical protein
MPQQKIKLMIRIKDRFYRELEYVFNNVRFEVFMVVTMKNAVFWDVAPCRSCVNQHFGRKYHLHLQGRKIRKRGTSMSRGLQTAEITVFYFSLLRLF